MAHSVSKYVTKHNNVSQNFPQLWMKLWLLCRNVTLLFLFKEWCWRQNLSNFRPVCSYSRNLYFETNNSPNLHKMETSHDISTVWKKKKKRIENMKCVVSIFPHKIMWWNHKFKSHFHKPNSVSNCFQFQPISNQIQFSLLAKSEMTVLMKSYCDVYKMKLNLKYFYTKAQSQCVQCEHTLLSHDSKNIQVPVSLKKVQKYNIKLFKCEAEDDQKPLVMGKNRK